jgi:hypothetical protein
MSDSGTQYGDFRLYRYDPSMAAAVIFILAFIVITALHFYQMVRTKTYFFVPFVIGGLLEVIGYIGVSRSVQLAKFPVTDVFLSACRIKRGSS